MVPPNGHSRRPAPWPGSLRSVLVFLLSVAPATGALVPLAAQETTAEVYGNLSYSFNRVGPAGEAAWTAVDNASRVGLRGGVVGEGIEALYHLEAGALVNAGSGTALSQRFFLAGVRGSFGTITLGRHSTPYKVSGVRVDPFYDTSTLSVAGGLPRGPVASSGSFGLSRMTNGWADRGVTYRTPHRAGVSASASAFLGPQGGQDLAFGVLYERDGVRAGVDVHGDRTDGAVWSSTEGVDRAVRVHTVFRVGGPWSIGASVESLEPEVGDRQNLLYARGTLRATDGVQLVMALGRVGEGGAGHPSGTAVHAGAFWGPLPRVRIHGLYSHGELDDAGRRRALSVGLRVGFAWSPTGS